MKAPNNSKKIEASSKAPKANNAVKAKEAKAEKKEKKVVSSPKAAPTKKAPLTESHNETPVIETFKKSEFSSDAPVLLDVRHMKEYFHFKGGDTKYLKAVHDVSFQVHKGEVFGLVGESGCGKTTTGRCIMKLYPLTSGDVWFDGTRIAAGTRWNEKEIKYTSLRTRNAIKKIEEEKAQALASFNSHFEKSRSNFGKANLFLAKKEVKAGKGSDLELKKKWLDEYERMVAPLDIEIMRLQEKADAVHNIQRDKIKAAHHDDRNADKAIAAKEVEKVKLRYGALLSKVEKADASSLSEEELAEYKQYKSDLSKAKHMSIANKIQMIFQDPIASLDPRMTVRNIIAEGLIIQGCHDKEFINSEVAKVLTLVGLVPEHANRYPHEFSGGQRQRIGIARAIIMNPELIVADEPVSALDVSVQAQVINLLNDLRHKLGLTIIFIAHNLSVVKYFCDTIAVMYYGNLVELASSEELFKHPLHPYTKSLLSAVPFPDPIIESTRKRVVYVPSRDHDYSKEKPSFIEITPHHFVSCNEEERQRYLKELGLDGTKA